jgi:hypothetical protein
MVKNNNVYSILIIFFIFIAIKKTYDIIIDYKYPTYEYIEKADPSQKYLFTIRNLFSLSSIVFILYIICFFKLNSFIFIILILFFIQNIMYFLIDKRYIYNFVDKENLNMNVIILIDKVFNGSLNLIVALYAFYVLINIFRRT